VLASGIYMDTSNMKGFVDEAVTPDKLEEYIR
jgi:hypothetical protein